MRNALERLAFIDETSVKTTMVKTTGWAPVGDRLRDHAPFTAEPTRGVHPEGRRSLVPLPAALQPGPEPDRDGLLEAQGTDPQGRSRTSDELWRAVGKVCDLFSEEECFNYFQAAGYVAD